MKNNKRTNNALSLFQINHKFKIFRAAMYVSIVLIAISNFIVFGRQNVQASSNCIESQKITLTQSDSSVSKLPDTILRSSTTISSSNGAYGTDSARISTEHIYLDDSISSVNFSSTNTDLRITIAAYSNDGTFISPTTGWKSMPYTYTVPSNASQIAIAISYNPPASKLPIEIDDVNISISGSLSIPQPTDTKCQYKLHEQQITPERKISGGGGNQGANFVAGNYWQSINPSSDDLTTSAGNVRIWSVDYTSGSSTVVSEFKHYFGHLNSFAYNKSTNNLVFGNGSSSYTLAPHFYTVNIDNVDLTDTTGSNNTLENVDAVTFTVPTSFGAKANAIWGDDGEVILITNDGANIRRLRLATGTEQLQYGTYTPSISVSGYNGTYDVTAEYSIYEPYDVVQGAAWVNHRLVLSLGHGPAAIAVIDLLDDGYMDYNVYRDSTNPAYFISVWYDDEAGVFGGQYNQTLYIWSDTNFSFTNTFPNPTDPTDNTSSGNSDSNSSSSNTEVFVPGVPNTGKLTTNNTLSALLMIAGLGIGITTLTYLRRNS